MARPFEWTILDTVVDATGKERVTLGVDTMYAIKNGDNWVINSTKDPTMMTERRYIRMMYANRASAQTQCDKLNDLYDCIEYKVVRIQED